VSLCLSAGIRPLGRRRNGGCAGEQVKLKVRRYEYQSIYGLCSFIWTIEMEAKQMGDDPLSGIVEIARLVRTVQPREPSPEDLFQDYWWRYGR
jgi:hypothetical protein